MDSDQDVTGSTPWEAYAVTAAGPVTFCFINIWSRLHDQSAGSTIGNSWEVIVWESSSAIVTLLLLPLVALAVVMGGLPTLAEWRRFAKIHVVAVSAFFILHVSGFIIIRHTIYAVLGSQYRFGGFQSWLYELPKDMVTYMISAIVIGTVSFLLRTKDEECADKITIQEGARTYFIKPNEIVAVNAAGNYAEFRLTDGRMPLMRTTLSALERDLGKHGIVRTHRSWLINPVHIREIGPTGGGDYRLLLQPGVEASVSRRYANVLAQLKRI